VNVQVHTEEIIERGQHHHTSHDCKASLIRAKFRMWMITAVEVDMTSTFEQLHRDVVTSMRCVFSYLIHALELLLKFDPGNFLLQYQAKKIT
jgi:hypothetical protein